MSAQTRQSGPKSPPPRPRHRSGLIRALRAGTLVVACLGLVTSIALAYAPIDEVRRSGRLAASAALASSDSTVLGRASVVTREAHSSIGASAADADLRGDVSAHASEERVAATSLSSAPATDASAGSAAETPSESAPSIAATPAPTVRAATAAPPTPAPTQAVAAAPSGSRCPTPMPTSAPAGWSRAVTSTFSESVKVGAWPGPVAAQAWKNRARGPDSSGRGTYDSSRTVSEADGLLDIWVHSEGNTRLVAAPVSTLGGMRGARISICMRADVIPGYKIAFLLWPTEGDGNSMGEIDFPEGKLAGGGATAKAFMHHVGSSSQDAFDTGVAVQGWHTYTIEWDPTASRPYVSFLLDGRLLGTTTDRVPTVPMFYVMQVETYLRGDPLPAPASGHVQVDWVTIDLP